MKLTFVRLHLLEVKFHVPTNIFSREIGTTYNKDFRLYFIFDSVKGFKKLSFIRACMGTFFGKYKSLNPIWNVRHHLCKSLSIVFFAYMKLSILSWSLFFNWNIFQHPKESFFQFFKIFSADGLSLKTNKGICNI